MDCEYWPDDPEETGIQTGAPWSDPEHDILGDIKTAAEAIEASRHYRPIGHVWHSHVSAMKPSQEQIASVQKYFAALDAQFSEIQKRMVDKFFTNLPSSQPAPKNDPNKGVSKKKQHRRQRKGRH